MRSAVARRHSAVRPACLFGGGCGEVEKGGGEVEKGGGEVEKGGGGEVEKGGEVEGGG